MSWSPLASSLSAFSKGASSGLPSWSSLGSQASGGFEGSVPDLLLLGSMRQNRFTQDNMENGVLPDHGISTDLLIKSLSHVISRSLSGSTYQGSSTHSASATPPAPPQEDASLLDRIGNLGSFALSVAAQALSGIGGGTLTKTLTDPRVQIALGAIGVAAALYPEKEKLLRNVNIEIAADEESKTYVIGIGQKDRERTLTLRIEAGKPIEYPLEPGVNLDNARAINAYDESNTQSSIGFLSIFGFLNVFKYKTKEKMTVYNIIVSDSQSSAYLKKGPKVTKIMISKDELIQVIHTKASDTQRIFDILAEEKRSKASALPNDINHVQLVSVDVNELDADEPTYPAEKVVYLPKFDNRTDEFVRVVTHLN